MLFHSLYVYAQDVFTILLLFLLFFCVGYSVLLLIFNKHFLSLEKKLSDFIFIGFVGLFFYIKVAFILGLIGLFYLELLMIITVIMIIPLYFVKDRLRLFRFPAVNYGHAFIILLALIFGLRTYFLFVGADGLSYHLPYARSFLENHRITVEEHLIYPLHTLDVNLLFSMLLMIDNEFLLRLFNILTFSTLAVLIYDYLCHKVSPWLALLAPIVILSPTVIMFMSLSIYVDFAFSFFVTISFIAFMQWYEKKPTEQALIYLSIAALGVAAAASTKYFGLVYGFILFLMLIFCSDKKIKDASIFLSICVLFGSAWYVRNLIISGNPFHPFLSNVFGYYLWTAEDLAFNLMELKSHGLGKNLDYYIKEIIKIGFFPLLTVFLSLPISILQWRKRQSSVLIKINILLALLCCLYFIFWYQTARIDRYILPILGLASISFVLTIHLVFKSKRYFKFASVAICILSASFTLVKVWQENVPLFLNYPVSQFEGNMIEKASAYPLMQQANKLKIPENRVYQVLFADRAYYYKGIAAGHWMGNARWSNVAIRKDWQLTLKPASKVLRYLQSNRYYALIVNKRVNVNRKDLKQLFNIVYEDKDGFIALPKKEFNQ